MGDVRDWTAFTGVKTGFTGVPEYRIESDGLCRWRGILTLTGVGGNSRRFILPPETIPLHPNVYTDYTTAAGDSNIFVGAYLGSIQMLPGQVVANLAGQIVDLSKVVYLVAPLPDPFATHTLKNVMDGVARALRTIPELRVYDFPSSRVEPPAAVLSMPQTPYDVTLGGRTDAWTFPLWVLVSKADDRMSYAEMIPYLEAEGARSFRAAIEADRTLGGACDTVTVMNARPLFASVGGNEFLAIEFTLEVFT